MFKKKIERFIKERLTGDVQKNALDFAAWLRANDMRLERQTVGYWADKIYFICSYTSEYVCYIAINEYDENNFVVWSDDSGSMWFENPPLDERTREIAWKNVNVCDDPSACESCKLRHGTRKTMFGKEFHSVCPTALKFINPDAEEMACMKKLFKIRKADILGG